MDWTEIKKYMQNKNKTRPSAPIFSENLTINNQFLLHGLKCDRIPLQKYQVGTNNEDGENNDRCHTGSEVFFQNCTSVRLQFRVV